MTPRRYDIAILGGGPGGAWCAHELAAAGANVAIIDGSHPREKPCGGGVTARALSLVGALTTDAAMTIRTGSFAYAGRSAAIDLAAHAHGSRLKVFSRREFDGRLLQRAVDTGATFLAERITEITRHAGEWTLATRAGAITARWLIGADGANSLVRRRVAQPFARADLSIACGYFVHGATSTHIDIEFVAKPAGYIWAFPRPDHIAVGIGAQADEATTPVLMGIVDTWLRTHLPDDARHRERYSWPIPSLTTASLEREEAAGDGWMLVGDAAGLVDPITREGIFFALLSGRFAAESLVRGADPAATYRERLRDSIYPELLRAARLKARFYRPAFVGLLVHALQRSERIRDVMGDLVAGEQPYESLRARLLKTCEFSLLWDLVRLQRT
jgi:geranylgeranyl reductase family protein